MVVPRDHKIVFINSCSIILYFCIDGISILTNPDPDALGTKKDWLAICNDLYLIYPVIG